MTVPIIANAFTAAAAHISMPFVDIQFGFSTINARAACEDGQPAV